ncbi:hypothetical protein [Thalassobacillus hwangdonensis]|uniref:hypothetical protein n=1 Tax=Thalassobacillus hwangdonensis TaxID=546108 RepID=UPI0036DAD225
MKKILLILLLVLSACSSTYAEDDVVAEVYGKEITLRDVQLLHEYDDEDLPQVVKTYVKQEIIIQEAKKLNLDISDYEGGMNPRTYELPPPAPEGHINPIRDFILRQSEKLSMTPEEYMEVYYPTRNERHAYFAAYLDEKFGTLETESLEKHEKTNAFYKNLLTLYEDDVEIYVGW